MFSKNYCIDSEHVIENAIKYSNMAKEEFACNKYAILLFSNYLLDYFKKKLNMESTQWLAPYHPYASNYLYKGSYKGVPISAIMPPMGASPIASVAEDLITCGVKVLFLICGAWGIAQNVKLLDFLIPTHAIGPDGTSIHYGRPSNEKTVIDKEIVTLFLEETMKRTEKYHVGRNYSMEAFYRIEKAKVKKLQQNGYISIENGELNILATICNRRKINFGALFYSYYNPLENWTIPWLQEEYKKCVEFQGEITLATLEKLVELH